MAKFRKLPVEIEAVQFTGQNMGEIKAFCQDAFLTTYGPRIRTLEGEMNISFDDWIIKGVAGEFYPCKSDIFEQTYETVV
jgi:hypothetical protein